MHLNFLRHLDVVIVIGPIVFILLFFLNNCCSGHDALRCTTWGLLLLREHFSKVIHEVLLVLFD